MSADTILRDSMDKLKRDTAAIERLLDNGSTYAALTSALCAMRVAGEGMGNARLALIGGDPFDSHDGEVKEDVLREACRDAEER